MEHFKVDSETNSSCIKIVPDTKVNFLSTQYRLVFCLDMSSSVASIVSIFWLYFFPKFLTLNNILYFRFSYTVKLVFKNVNLFWHELLLNVSFLLFIKPMGHKCNSSCFYFAIWLNSIVVQVTYVWTSLSRYNTSVYFIMYELPSHYFYKPFLNLKLL